MSDTTSSLPDHVRTPHLRPVQPIPVQKEDGKQYVALRDPAMLNRKTMVIPAGVVAILQHFNGQKDLESVATALRVNLETLVGLAKGLDELGLLWGPTFERYEAELRNRLAEDGAFPTRSTVGLGETEEAANEQIGRWLAETEDPELDSAVKAIVAPHLDYERGWPNYAAAYRPIVDTDAPDRVLILGTNHMGIGDGVVLTEYGFDSAAGRCEADYDFIRALVEDLGDTLLIDQLDHLPEHSIELHIPWIRHVWGDVPVVGALIPDPLAPMIEDDGERISVDAFVESVRRVIDQSSGRTFVVASADLSHVGPQFGEPRPVDERRRHDVELQDRDTIGKYITCEPEEFLGAVRWSANPTRWCSVGNMYASLGIVRPTAAELIDYRQAFDEQGQCLVSSAAIALLDG